MGHAVGSALEDLVEELELRQSVAEGDNFHDVNHLRRRRWDTNRLPLRGGRSLAAHAATFRLAQLSGSSSCHELWNNADEDADYAVLGMPPDSDWALIAPYYDRALIRTPVVYQLGRDIGLNAPRVRLAEVYVNYASGQVQALRDFVRARAAWMDSQWR